jgi:Zn-dependent protease
VDEYPYRDYDPIQPRGTNWRGILSKIWAPVAALLGIAVKFGGVALKFGTIFIAFAGYLLLWPWQFALGVVLMILVHELGHYVEAARERLNPSLPVFIPFLGAYVRHTGGNPWQTARVAIAGPILGGAASGVVLAVAEANDSRLLFALAYFGFFINLVNLIPFGILDGGAVWRSARWLRRGGGREKAYFVYALYFATAAALALGMWAAYVPQHRV